MCIPQMATVKGGRIAVEDAYRAGQRLAVGGLNSGQPVVLAQDAAGLGRVKKRGPHTPGQTGKGGGKGMHPARDAPNPLGFGPPDQRKHGGGTRWNAADIGGVAPEKLDQARVAEMGAQ